MNKNELRIISLKYRTLASQMLKIDHEDEVRYIKMFLEFVDSTNLLSEYVSNCHKSDYDFNSILQSRGYGQHFELPDNSEDIVDYDYQLLKFIIENNRPLIGITLGYSHSNKFADSIAAFMRKTIEPFVIALREYIEIKLIEADDTSSNDDNATVRTNIFLSYCQKDSKIADLIDDTVSSQTSSDLVSITRDIRDVKYHQSFKRFMDSIQDHDYVVMLISDRYLKSRNCLYEVLETIKDHRFKDRLAYIVLCDDDSKWLEDSSEKIGAKVYAVQDQAQYTIFWRNKEKEIRDKIDEIGDPAYTIELSKELKHIQKILLDLQDLLSFLSEYKGLPLQEYIDTNFNEILKYMKLK